MASISGKTKQVVCIICGETFEASLYASAKTAKCKQCKKVKAKVDKPLIQDAKVQEMQKRVAVSGGPDTKPLKIMLVRNRQDIEGHVVMDTGEVIERVPAEWKPIVNELDYLSVSKMTSYCDCPFKFHDTYMMVTDPEKDNGNIFTWFGSILHEVGELAEKAYALNGIKLNPLQLYDDAWKKRQLTDFKMYGEGRELVLDYFGRHPIGSNPYVTVATEFEWRGKIGDLIPDAPDEVRNMDFGAQLDFIGEIDPETAILKDYKTNRVPYTPADLEASLQLQVYEMIARKAFPQYKKWITGYEMFRFGWQQCPTRSQEDLDAVGQYVVNVATQIIHDEKWLPKLNHWCSYCSIRHKCHEYCTLMNDPQRMIDTIKTDMTDIASIETNREKLATAEKLISNRKEELANIVKATIQQATLNSETVVVDGKELYLQSQSRPSYNYYSAKQVMLVHGLSDALDKCVKIDKTKLDKIAKEHPEVALELAKCLEQGFSAPYLMKRIYKKK